jgi:outer membrane protein TolC
MLACVLSAVTANAQPTQPAQAQLTLEQAVDLALARNERSTIAALDAEVAEAQLAKARVAFLPVLQATGRGTYAPWDKSHEVANGQLQFTQPIIAPSAWPLYDQAKHQLDAQKAQSFDDRRELAFETAHAFFQVLLAERVLEAAQHKLDTATQNLANTDAQVKAQLTSSNDVTRAQTDLAGSQRELAADQGNLAAAYLQLELLVHARVARGLVVPTALIEASQRPLGPVDALVASSLKDRPDLAAHRSSALAAHDFAREPHMRWFPTLSFQATGSASNVGSPTVDGQLSLAASWSIYDAGARSADERVRDANAEIADLTADGLARSVDAQVRTAAAQLTASQQALASSQAAMDAARKSASETDILYKQGLAKAIELVDANEQRFLAEVSFAEAQFSLATADLALLQAMGRGPLEAQ